MAQLSNMKPGSHFVCFGGQNFPDQYGTLVKVNECRARVKWMDGNEADVTPGLGIKILTDQQWQERLDLLAIKAKEEAKSGNKSTTKATPSPHKKRKGVEMNEWGFNPTSQAGQIDACFNGSPVTIDDLHAKLGFPKGRIKSHCADRVRRGKIKLTDKGYIRVGVAETTKKTSRKGKKSDKPAESGTKSAEATTTATDKPKRRTRKKANA